MAELVLLQLFRDSLLARLASYSLNMHRLADLQFRTGARFGDAQRFKYWNLDFSETQVQYFQQKTEKQRTIDKTVIGSDLLNLTDEEKERMFLQSYSKFAHFIKDNRINYIGTTGEKLTLTHMARHLAIKERWAAGWTIQQIAEFMQIKVTTASNYITSRILPASRINLE
jgi:hypothetical protein